MLGQLVEIGIVTTRRSPVDVETSHHVPAESQRDVRGDGFDVGRAAGDHQQTDVLLPRQPLQCGGNGFGDGLRGIVDSRQMRGQPVQEPVDGVHRRGDEQRLGAGEVPVDRLPGDPTVRATSEMLKSAPLFSIAFPAAARIRATASSSLAGAEPDQPWVRTKEL